MEIKMVVFDMAGTVVDEDNIVYKTLRTAINELEYDFTLEAVLQYGAGKEKLQATRDILKLVPEKFSEEKARSIHAKFEMLLAAAYQTFPVRPQPGAEEVFQSLTSQNIFTVLNTGYNRETAQGLLDKLGWKEGAQIDLLVTASDTKRNRPYPDMIEFAMRKLGVADPGQVIKVGDSIIDIEEGRSAGCRFCIGITTGAHTREQLQTAHPDHIIDQLSDLLNIIHPSV